MDNRQSQAREPRARRQTQPRTGEQHSVAEKREPMRQSGRGLVDDSRREPSVEQNVEEILLRIEDTVQGARKVPLSDQCMVDREEMLFLINLVREQLPEELRQAKWLLQQNRQLIVEARKEAEIILRDAESKMARMIDEHEITQQAQIEAQRLVDEATIQSRQIHAGAIDYARDLLVELEDQLTEMLVYIQKNKKELD